MDTPINSSSVKCGLLNVQSVRNKTFDIYDTIKDENLDIFAITETWLTDYDSAVIKEMTPVSHTFIHNARHNRRGGGVGLFLANSFKKIKRCNVVNRETFELLQVECEIDGSKISFVVVYRPPITSVNHFIDEFRTYLATIDMVSANVIVCGDFNLWVEDIKERYIPQFIDTMETFNLINMVDKPTSLRGHTIDLVFADRSRDLIHNLKVESECNLSPVHKMVTFMMPYIKVQGQKRKIKFRSKRDLDSTALLASIFDDVTSKSHEACVHRSIEKQECATCFYKLYNTITCEKYEEMCSIVEMEIIVKDNAPWYNGEIHRAKIKKKKKERRWRRHKSDETRRQYIEARNYVNQLIRKRKCEFYSEKTLQAGTNINKLYKVLDNLTGNKKMNKLPEGYSDGDLAAKFLDFFDNKISGIIESFSDNDVYDVDENIQECEVKLSSFHTVDKSVVKGVMTKAKLTHCVNDPIPMNLIVSSENFDLMVDITTDLVNKSIKEGVFPISEKQAIVKPIVKGKLDPQSFSSFRPVSNLTFQSKILESVILMQLTEHLQTVGALPDSQSAYRRYYSTETALCSIVSDMRGLLDDGKCGILVLLDLSAAFDTVVHDILLKDCKNIGIEGAALTYIEGYLDDRTYRVQVGECFSNVKSLRRGVPQGSVLGPILFCIYTADLANVLRRHGVTFKLFADDTQFYMSLNNVQSVEAKISEIMSDIGKWMSSRQLKLNTNKTECLVVGRQLDFERLNIRDLCINEIKLPMSNSVKDLGVLLDSDLSLKSQIDQTVKIAGYHLRNISFVRKYLNKKIIKMLVHNHVLSKLDYCNSLYYGLPNYLLNKLQLIMNRAARLITGQSWRERVTPALIKLHWLPVKARIIYKQCVMVYHALKFGKPLYMSDMLKKFEVDTTVILRHSVEVHRLDEPRYQREAGRRAFCRSAPRLYNQLPQRIKMEQNVATFKKKLKEFLFTDCYDLENQLVTAAYSC